MRLLIAALSLWLLVPSAEAKPSRHGVDVFAGDRYVRLAQVPSAQDMTRSARCPPLCKKPRKQKRKRDWREPGVVDRIGKRNIFRGFAETLRDAGPSKSLAGVVGPLAAKARELQATCGARVISAVRHTYIAGTGGRLSLHASGRAVDMAGNPACMYRLVRDWPGGVSVDYWRVRHLHLSFAPNGPEWRTRFHHRTGRRNRHARRRAV